VTTQFLMGERNRHGKTKTRALNLLPRAGRSGAGFLPIVLTLYCVISEVRSLRCMIIKKTKMTKTDAKIGSKILLMDDGCRQWIC